ncbi:MAG TPA: hypothetical protein VE842_07195, partial [Pyrinomonadaceae bacterium]|nr:hypothetical protein [Pyrinomonadaceae bacterium]
VIALLLTISLALTAMGLGRSRPDAPPVDKGSAEITADEEREAREIVTRLTTRWRETEDIGPLTEELFVADFADRLRYEPQYLFFSELKTEQLGPEDREDLRRHYVAMTNLLHLFVRLYEVYLPLRKSEEEGGEEFEPEKLLPANVIEVFKSNPTLSAIYDEELGDKAETPANQSPDQSVEGKRQTRVETIEQLRALTDTVERAVVLLRDHVRTLPLTLPASELVKEQDSQGDSEPAESEDSTKPRVYILSEDFYGYPSGTRLICVDILPFHMDLVRVGQRLKVLTIHIQSD